MKKYYQQKIHIKLQNKPKRLDFNNKAFYDSHPDLMPRNNLLLYLERVITKEELDKTFNKTPIFLFQNKILKKY